MGQNLAAPPKPARNWALFVDLDGTVLDFATRPDGVIVPAGLIADLRAVEQWLGGALAVVSGRSLRDIDRLLSAHVFCCAAEHGAVVRLQRGMLRTAEQRDAVPESWRQQIRAGVRDWPGVLVEEKTFSVAVHFRLAPERRDDVYNLLQSVVAAGNGFELLAAQMALEIRHHRLTKGAAIAEFMRNAPFLGRLPVFVGDDITDEDGFREVVRLGGLPLRVEKAFDGSPLQVRRWLHRFQQQDWPYAPS